jgi:predicted NUDIX family NTP pyrophosphohydrolase
MPRTSAGILLYRLDRAGPEVLLGHMGGPFWAKKDDGGWSIPKGEHGPDEDPLAVARREFTEELGFPVPGDLDVTATRSNTFELEWPPRSGRMQQFPEIDRAAWFGLDEARSKLVPGQVPFLDRLTAHLSLGM